jgi:hypothetical protein
MKVHTGLKERFKNGLISRGDAIATALVWPSRGGGVGACRRFIRWINQRPTPKQGGKGNV